MQFAVHGNDGGQHAVVCALRGRRKGTTLIVKFARIVDDGDLQVADLLILLRLAFRLAAELFAPALHVRFHRTSSHTDRQPAVRVVSFGFGKRKLGENEIRGGLLLLPPLGHGKGQSIQRELAVRQGRRGWLGVNFVTGRVVRSQVRHLGFRRAGRG